MSENGDSRTQRLRAEWWRNGLAPAAAANAGVAVLAAAATHGGELLGPEQLMKERVPAS